MVVFQPNIFQGGGVFQTGAVATPTVVPPSGSANRRRPQPALIELIGDISIGELTLIGDIGLEEDLTPFLD